MKQIITISLVVMITSLSAFAQSKKPVELATVANVDLNRYQGKWYEIARYPNKFQNQCVGNVTATYTLKGEGKLEVFNQCMGKDGKLSGAKAAGKIADKATNAKLKVRFAPAFISFLSFVWADYWVIELADDYTYAVVGTPDRDYFWILSREAEMKEPLYNDILRRAASKGFDPKRVIKTPQGLASVNGSSVN